MKFRGTVLRVGIFGLMAGLVVGLAAATPVVRALNAPDMQAPGGLSIVEIKMTGDEFVVLQNNTGTNIADLSTYALYYFNNYNPFAKDVSSSTAGLPATSLAAGQSILLSGDARQTCGATVAGDLGISLGDSSGFLEVVQLGSANGAVTQQAGDVVSWSSTANGIIPNVPSSTKDPASVYYRYQNGASYPWQYADVDATNPCQLNAVIVSGTTKTSVPTDGSLVSSDDVVPGTIVSLAGGGTVIASTSGSGSLPASDIGLKSPKLSELLPDPKSPATDANDEFIELYNPNDTAFDLSSFTLQVGSTTSTLRHNYVFPAGTTLPPKGFKAFYSSQTKLSLSNTGGQVWLLDPLGTSIAQSDPYNKPKEGTAWASANGKWYYTTMLTPGAANSVKEPAAKSSGKSSPKTTKKTSTGAAVLAASTGSSTAGGTADSAYGDNAQTLPLHPVTLAVVVGLALLYGAYEYRHDLANRFQQFREHRAARS